MLDDPGNIENPRDIAASAEGQLLVSHRATFGRFPPWNHISGSRYGTSHAGKYTPGHFSHLTCRRSSIFIARYTIREIAATATLELNELAIHAARLNAVLSLKIPLDDRDVFAWIDRLRAEPRWSGDIARLNRLVADGYLRQKAPFCP